MDYVGKISQNKDVSFKAIVLRGKKRTKVACNITPKVFAIFKKQPNAHEYVYK